MARRHYRKTDKPTDTLYRGTVPYAVRCFFICRFSNNNRRMSLVVLEKKFKLEYTVEPTVDAVSRRWVQHTAPHRGTTSYHFMVTTPCRRDDLTT
ncbi:unnamed protein product [Euphydryas editha]|uniref:Uncharacterized protein n=1 Tax=Euphydryas editha TaxID=104508 RepID=A0AAU9UTR2_EUPED|nr:unnamed protein product [Euphydryas editha]